MFTQCSKCETVFRLSAEALRAAGGQVRCGRCGEVFNALARLAEDSAGYTKGESPLELETRADEILESVLDQLEEVTAQEAVDDEPAAELPPGAEVARLQFIEPIDEELIGENSLEFTLSPGELDRIFIETRALPLPPLPPLPQPQPLPPHPEDAAVPQTRVTGLEVSEDVRQDLLAPYQYDYGDLQSRGPPRTSRRFAAWLAAAVVLGGLLLVQMVRGNREWMATHLPLLATGYATTPDADLSSYQLRQWGVTGDPAASGTLRVRASIMNTAARLQRYPLLRVSLVNRFGSRVGAREFEPSEYLGKATTRMLAPGERADATLDILDPGNDAEGFEIDVCLRRVDKTVVCAGDAASRTK